MEFDVRIVQIAEHYPNRKLAMKLMEKMASCTVEICMNNRGSVIDGLVDVSIMLEAMMYQLAYKDEFDRKILDSMRDAKIERYLEQVAMGKKCNE